MTKQSEKSNIKQVMHEKALLECIFMQTFELLILSLPYVEEGEEYNKPSKRNLSRDIRALINQIQETFNHDT